MGTFLKIAALVFAMWMVVGILPSAYGQSTVESHRGSSEVKAKRTARTNEDVRSFFNATELPSGEFFAYHSTSKTASQRCSLRLQADPAAKTVTATTTSIDISNQWGYNPQGGSCQAPGVTFTFVCREMSSKKIRCYFDKEDGSAILWGWYNDQVNITWRPRSLDTKIPSSWFAATSYINRRQSTSDNFGQLKSYTEQFFLGLLPSGVYEVYASTMPDGQIRGLDCLLWFDSSAYPKKVVAIAVSVDEKACSHEGMMFTFYCNLRTQEGFPKACEYRKRSASSLYWNIGILGGVGGGILKIMWHQSQPSANADAVLVDAQRYGVVLLRPHASNTEMPDKSKEWEAQVAASSVEPQEAVEMARLEPVDPKQIRDEIVALFAEWPALSERVEVNNGSRRQILMSRQVVRIHYLKSMSLAIEDGCEAKFVVLHEEMRGGKQGAKVAEIYTYTLNVGDLDESSIAIRGDRVLISSRKPIKKHIVTSPYVNARGLREHLRPYERSTRRVELATSREKIRELRGQDLIGLFTKLGQACRDRQG